MFGRIIVISLSEFNYLTRLTSIYTLRQLVGQEQTWSDYNGKVINYIPSTITYLGNVINYGKFNYPMSGQEYSILPNQAFIRTKFSSPSFSLSSLTRA